MDSDNQDNTVKSDIIGSGLIKLKQLNLMLKKDFVAYFEYFCDTEEIRWSYSALSFLDYPNHLKPDYQTFLSKIHPDDLEKFLTAKKLHLTNNEILNVQVRVINFHEEYIFVLARGQALRDHVGKPVKLIMSIERIDQVDSNFDQEEKFQAIFQQSEKLCAIFNPQGHLIDVNDTAIKFAGTTRDQLLGKSFWEPPFAYSKAGQDRVKKAAEGVFAGRTINYQFTYPPHIFDGASLDVCLKPVKNTQNQIIYVLGEADIITEIKKVQKELRQINETHTLAIESSMAGIWDWDIVNNNVVWTDRVYEILGYEPQSFVPSTEFVYNTYHPDDRDTINKTLENHRILKKSPALEYRARKADGTYIWLQGTRAMKFDENGNAVRAVGSIFDIDERKKAEFRLKDSERKFREIFNNAYQLSAILKPDGTLLDVNEIALNVLGFTLEEIKGKKLYQLRDNPENEEYRQNIKNIIEKAQQGSTVKEEVFFYDYKGDFHIIDISVKPVKNYKNETEYLIAEAYDITELRQINKKLISSNQRYNLAVASSAAGIWEWIEEDGKKDIWWSPKLYELLNLDPKTTVITYQLIREIIHPDDFEQNRKAYKKHLKHQVPFVSETRYYIKNIGYQWFYETAQALWNDQGRAIRMAGAVYNINERKQASSMLEKNEQKFKALFNQTYQLSGLLDPTGRILEVNETTLHFSHSESKDFIHKYLWDSPFQTKSNLDKNQLKKLILEASKGEFIRLEIDFKVANDDLRRLDFSLKPVMDTFGEIIMILPEARDITDLKSVQLKAEQTSNLLLEKNKQLEEFAHITSHNLRSHTSNLTVLMGFLNDADNEADKTFYLEKVREVTQQLQNTIDVLSETLKVKEGMDIKSEKLSFAETLKNTLQVLSGQLMQHNAVINADFSLVDELVYPKTYLESIFLNLLSNAIKYQSPDRKLKVDISTKKIDKKVVLEVTDNGLGIDLERYSSKIFGLYKTFHRGKDSRGVGLFLIKNEIESLGGTISVKSEVNKGTSFIVNF